tara:strand:+ start:5638 stop:7917 length:2280 start_codon:yes stop_codon:yes gene_type:complete
MSLITLSSQRNISIQRDTDPAIIKNYFKDGIRLREGTEVALVSLTINKLDLYEIITGLNDIIIWRIGNAQSFSQHSVTIGAGNYNGTQLAVEIALRLNQSTIIGLYVGNWTCVFDQTAQKGAGAFTIDYGQTPAPIDPSTNTFEAYSGTPVFQNNETDNVAINGSVNGRVADYADQTNPVIITGKKGIFANEGDFNLIVRPQDGYSLADQITALKLQNIQETFYELGVPELRDLTLVDTTGVPLTNGWFLQGNTTPVSDPLFWTYLGDGEWGLLEDGTVLATRQNIVDNGGNFVFYNPTRAVFADADNGGRHLANTSTGSLYSYTAAPFTITIALSNLGYGSSNVGYVRNSLYNGQIDYPATPSAEIKANQNAGYDIMINTVDNVTKDGIVFSLSKMKQTQGTTFPNAGWRNASEYVFQNIDPLTGFSSLPNISGDAPTNWASFNYPNDHIKMRVQIVSIIKVNIYLSHDTAGDGTFVEEVLVRRTGDNNGFQTTIVEKFYPLRPCLSISGGNQYQSSRYIVNGIFDSTEIINPTSLYKDTPFIQTAEDETETDLRLDSSATDLTLSALFKYGLTYASDVPPMALGDLQPQGSINNIIGFDRYYIYPAGSVSNSTTSSSEPITTIREPTLSLELTDFNIKGANGNTGDSMKVIAVIPKEELQTNEKTGTLHYYPAFPVFIDLNLPQEQIFYDLNAILRLPSGRVANDLINPTEMTLLFKESDESKQKRMMKRQNEMLASMIGNIQSAKINSIGNEFPLI